MNRNADRRVALWIAGAVLLLIVLVAIVAPATHDDDVTPSTFNSGTHGAKGAYLLLGALGYEVARSDQTAGTLPPSVTVEPYAIPKPKESPHRDRS